MSNNLIKGSCTNNIYWNMGWRAESKCLNGYLIGHACTWKIDIQSDKCVRSVKHWKRVFPKNLNRDCMSILHSHIYIFFQQSEKIFFGWDCSSHQNFFYWNVWQLHLNKTFSHTKGESHKKQTKTKNMSGSIFYCKNNVLHKNKVYF